MKSIQLIVTDLDGTFLNTYHDLNEENVRAVNAARQKSIVVCPVTARNFDCARYAILSAAFDPLCITNNGATIVDSRDTSLRFSNFIDPDSVRAIVEAAVEAEASVDVYTTQYTARYNPTARQGRSEFLMRWLEKPEDMRPHVLGYEELDALIQKVQHCAENITVHGKNLNELPGWFYRRVIEQGEFYLTSSHHACIDIMAYGSTKLEGVQRLAAMLNIPRESVMAFGDNSNDIGMIRWAGVGVAMDNAPDFVKRAADVVAPRNTEAGFATIVHQIIKQ